MHARAAAKFVRIASEFSCDIEVEHKSQRVNGKSIMGMMMLAVGKGSNIIIYADGDDAQEGTSKLSTLINNRFDEDE